MTEQAPFVFILGMHRSGTSCLAGAFELCGLYLGDVRRTGRYNAKGYFEIKKLVDIHDQILMLNRSTWNHPPKKVRVHPHHNEILRQYAAELARHRPCGLKDPRLLLLLDQWLAITPPPVQLVGTFRHPLAVAQSLATRNQMSQEQSIELWIHHNRLLVEQHIQTDFPLIEYNLQDTERYCRTVSSVSQKIGLNPAYRQIASFVSRELNHYTTPTAGIPTPCRDIYEYLCNHRFQETLSDSQLGQFQSSFSRPNRLHAHRWISMLRRIFLRYGAL